MRDCCEYLSPPNRLLVAPQRFRLGSEGQLRAAGIVTRTGFDPKSPWDFAYPLVVQQAPKLSGVMLYIR